MVTISYYFYFIIADREIFRGFDDKFITKYLFMSMHFFFAIKEHFVLLQLDRKKIDKYSKPFLILTKSEYLEKYKNSHIYFLQRNMPQGIGNNK